ncbi:type VII secretion system-associated protein [Streptomyces sp. NPDC057702]|uniref:type VII secretion system-associated protein n=1 Tax=unclassified Streptomyces TaxID=2593676 RepID=UPI0036C88DFA
MADKPPVNLDKTWLTNFQTQDVQKFLGEIKKIQGDGEYAPALANLIKGGTRSKDVPAGILLPLSIGGMAGEGTGTNGDLLQSGVTEMIKVIVKIFADQKLLFEAIDAGITDTLEDLLKTQGENLEKIEAEKFLDIFEDVDDLLGDGGSGSGGKDKD